MPIPPLDNRGLLPEGIYDATIDEIHERFAISPYRQSLFSDFLCFLSQELPFQRPMIYMAGSYLSDKLQPDDIELTVPLDLLSIQSPVGQKLFQLGGMPEHNRIKAQYRMDFYISLEMAGRPDFRLFFQYVGDKTAQAKGLNEKDKRGIIRII